MNCLIEALGLGAARQRHRRWPPTPTARSCSSRPAGTIVELARRYYETGRRYRCCRAAIATFAAFENAMTLDIAMGGSTNTVLHLLAAAHEARGAVHHARHRPPVPPRARAVQGRALGRRRARGGRAPRRRHHGHPGRARPRRADRPRRSRPCTRRRSARRCERWDIAAHRRRRGTQTFYRAAPGGVPTTEAFSQAARWDELDLDREKGVHPRRARTPSRRTAGWRCSTATSPRTAAS